ncbi:MAG: hypothetical protein MHM6MM_000247 [Cercozoa sp. M6MM]
MSSWADVLRRREEGSNSARSLQLRHEVRHQVRHLDWKRVARDGKFPLALENEYEEEYEEFCEALGMLSAGLRDLKSIALVVSRLSRFISLERERDQVDPREMQVHAPEAPQTIFTLCARANLVPITMDLIKRFAVERVSFARTLDMTQRNFGNEILGDEADQHEISRLFGEFVGLVSFVVARTTEMGGAFGPVDDALKHAILECTVGGGRISSVPLAVSVWMKLATFFPQISVAAGPSALLGRVHGARLDEDTFVPCRNVPLRMPHELVQESAHTASRVANQFDAALSFIRMLRAGMQGAHLEQMMMQLRDHVLSPLETQAILEVGLNVLTQPPQEAFAALIRPRTPSLARAMTVAARAHGFTDLEELDAANEDAVAEESLLEAMDNTDAVFHLPHVPSDREWFLRLRRLARFLPRGAEHFATQALRNLPEPQNWAECDRNLVDLLIRGALTEYTPGMPLSRVLSAVSLTRLSEALRLRAPDISVFAPRNARQLAQAIAVDRAHVFEHVMDEFAFFNRQIEALNLISRVAEDEARDVNTWLKILCGTLDPDDTRVQFALRVFLLPDCIVTRDNKTIALSVGRRLLDQLDVPAMVSILVRKVVWAGEPRHRSLCRREDGNVRADAPINLGSDDFIRTVGLRRHFDDTDRARDLLGALRVQILRTMVSLLDRCATSDKLPRELLCSDRFADSALGSLLLMLVTESRHNAVIEGPWSMYRSLDRERMTVEEEHYAELPTAFPSVALAGACRFWIVASLDVALRRRVDGAADAELFQVLAENGVSDLLRRELLWEFWRLERRCRVVWHHNLVVEASGGKKCSDYAGESTWARWLRTPVWPLSDEWQKSPADVRARVLRFHPEFDTVRNGERVDPLAHFDSDQVARLNADENNNNDENNSGSSENRVEDEFAPYDELFDVHERPVTPAPQEDRRELRAAEEMCVLMHGHIRSGVEEHGIYEREMSRPYLQRLFDVVAQLLRHTPQLEFAESFLHDVFADMHHSVRLPPHSRRLRRLCRRVCHGIAQEADDLDRNLRNPVGRRLGEDVRALIRGSPRGPLPSAWTDEYARRHETEESGTEIPLDFDDDEFAEFDALDPEVHEEWREALDELGYDGAALFLYRCADGTVDTAVFLQSAFELCAERPLLCIESQEFRQQAMQRRERSGVLFALTSATIRHAFFQASVRDLRPSTLGNDNLCVLSSLLVMLYCFPSTSADEYVRRWLVDDWARACDEETRGALPCRLATPDFRPRQEAARHMLAVLTFWAAHFATTPREERSRRRRCGNVPLDCMLQVLDDLQRAFRVHALGMSG